ncbi:hypothetical protein ISN44_As12g010000, partial [Arabidopsis suecica]
MAKASATIIILLILFCSLACEARVRLTSPDLPTDETVHKVEKLQQEQKRFPKSDPHFYPKKKNSDPHTIKAHLECLESYE